jgi:hypothetical protein
MLYFHFRHPTEKIFLSGVALASLTVPVMWIAVINQNLEPLGMTQVRRQDTKILLTLSL